MCGDTLMRNLRALPMTKKGDGNGNRVEIFIPKKIKPLTENQEKYIEAVQQSVIVCCSGPPGTGKSFIAAGLTVQMLQKNQIRKIILTRPLVECDEKLGYLPGSAREKVNLFMAPVLNILGEFLSRKDIQLYEEAGKIEISPLAFMRGANYNDCMVLIEESQNLSLGQIKMAICRLGPGAKMIMTGDVHQSDRVKEKINPFAFCMKKLQNLDKVAIIELENKDIIRNSLINIVLERLNN